MKKYVLITGASLGLGKALALELASQGRDLILVALPQEGLPQLARMLSETHGVTVRTYETNLMQAENIRQLICWLEASGFRVDFLINNAGIGGSKAFDTAELEQIENIIQLNVTGTALLTRLLLPFLLKFPKSYILNVSSLAAFTPIPYKTVYPASKAFIYSFSLSLRAELSAKGVQVSVLHPGPMPTSAENLNRLQKHGWLGQLSCLSVEAVAQIALKQVRRGQSIIIPGTFNKVGYWAARWIPWSWREPLLVSMLRKEISA